jgi:hypothetical protein
MYGNVGAGSSVGMSANFITTAAATNIDMRNKQCVINRTQELLYFSNLIIIDNKSTS